MTIKPLSQCPEYIQADAKLAGYVAELNAAREEAQRLEAERLAMQTAPEGGDALAAADAMLSGDALPSLAGRIERNRALARALERAVRAQEAAVRTIRQKLSREAAKAALPHHVELVQAVIAAAEALEAANTAERQHRAALEAAGFDSQLPALSFQPPGHEIEMQNPEGGYSTAWHADASRYVRLKLLPVEAAEVEGARIAASAAATSAREAAAKVARAGNEMGELVN